MSKIKKPKNKDLWVTYLDKNEKLRFMIFSNKQRDMYYLYEIDDSGELKEKGKAKSPVDLEKKYKIFELLNK